MLIAADFHGQRINAENASKAEKYICPACKQDVIVKQGLKVIPHFAHKSNCGCEHGKGESKDHKLSKVIMTHCLNQLGLTAHAEWEIPAVCRFADIGIISEHVTGVIELQKSKMCLNDQLKKSEEYARMKLRAVWITLSNINDLRAKPLVAGQVVERYRILGYERFACDHAGELYCLDPENRLIYVFEATPSTRRVPYTTFWDSDEGCMVEYGDYDKKLKSYMDLKVKRVIELINASLVGVTKPSESFESYNLPMRGVVRIQ